MRHVRRHADHAVTASPVGVSVTVRGMWWDITLGVGAVLGFVATAWSAWQQWMSRTDLGLSLTILDNWVPTNTASSQPIRLVLGNTSNCALLDVRMLLFQRRTGPSTNSATIWTDVAARLEVGETVELEVATMSLAMHDAMVVAARVRNGGRSRSRVIQTLPQPGRRVPSEKLTPGWRRRLAAWADPGR
jgi:hypothetical protein